MSVDRRGNGAAGGQKGIQLRTSFVPLLRLESFYSGGKVALGSLAPVSLETGQADSDRTQVGDDHFPLLVTPFGDEIRVTALSRPPRLLHTLKPNADVITSFAVDRNNSRLVACTRSCLLSSWDLQTGKQLRAWKGHEAPVLVSDFDWSCSLVATGSADSTIRVWDVDAGHATHAFRGHRGLVSAVSFFKLHTDAARRAKPNKLRAYWLISGGEDGTVRVWDLSTKSCLKVLSSHVSVVRGLSFTPSGGHCISAGRDRVICVWDLDSLSLVKTTPVGESVESVECLLPDHISPEWRRNPTDKSEVVVALAGDRGYVRMWNLTADREVASVGKADFADPQSDGADPMESRDNTQAPEPIPLHSLLYIPTQATLLSASTDATVRIHNLPTLQSRHVLAGQFDEVVDLTFLHSPASQPSSSNPQSTDTVPPYLPAFLAVATSSPTPRIYHLPTASVHLVSGHSAAVVALSATWDSSQGWWWLVTGSRDRTARVWRVDTPDVNAGEGEVNVRCLAVLGGHTEGVGGVAVASRTGIAGVKGRMAVTGGGEGVVKVWELGPEMTGDSQAISHPTSLVTLPAHTRTINHLTLSPNSQLLSTSSLDKTCRLFRLPNLDPVATLRGHTRGVWSSSFSPVDQVLATASADRTVRIWSLGSFACLRVLEGHLNSVLRAVFLSAGTQVGSVGSDGLLKVWSVREQRCVATVDAGEEKVWAIEVAGDGEVVATAGAEGAVRVWRDATREEEEIKRKEEEERVVKEQSLTTHLRRRAYAPAVHLALDLARPFQLMTILAEMLARHPPSPATLYPILQQSAVPASGPPRPVFSPKVDVLLDSLEGDKLDKVVGWVRDWNAQARYSGVAQMVMYVWSMGKTIEKIAGLPKGREYLTAFSAYTERHMRHATAQVTRSYLLDFVCESMAPVGTGFEEVGGLLEHGGKAFAFEDMDVDEDGDKEEEDALANDEAMDSGEENEKGGSDVDDDDVLATLPVVDRSSNGKVVQASGSDSEDEIADGDHGDKKSQDDIDEPADAVKLRGVEDGGDVDTSDDDG
ncbi:WD40 repeat-like protein [Gonapodya prolifera JEL478]|uniref:WD40 repeat-like protein n=1 Tax=Gonapodya prolifera (strain JEL478) TaxID=1344416 RepID=A0A139AW12_GONPJ|nr:WD40 repeat-like protein [Gonapodya prolifera JEL478]|eukprot:KXS20773.1 WD40 repeat-like protein [Gonapodya prolifera JEL478]